MAKILSRLSLDASDTRHIFTQLFHKVESLESHDAVLLDTRSPLAGALISVKDLFDVQGYVTRAGTRFMANDLPASQDATPIGLLRAAGATLVGHTNMTELAYSGLGLNPHYGTPHNALLPDAIPGGSTAGGAVSVALGLADIAIGTDTGGSLRIPAAFNGIVGFKPSQQTVSRQGCKALSQTLDSVGPMAMNVQACQLAYHTMRVPIPATAANPSEPVFIIPDNYGMDDLDATVAEGFTAAVDALQEAGFAIERKPLPLLDALRTLAVWQFAAVEARAEYDDAFHTCRAQLDPRIASRLARADEVNAVNYRKTLNQRAHLVEQFQLQMQGKMLLMPTVPIIAPLMSRFDDDDEYTRINLQVLRNPSIANVMNGCSISLPFRCQANSIGIMLTAPNGHDDLLLNTASRCETVFNMST